MKTTYGASLSSKFDKILALPVSESDNESRVAWLLKTVYELTGSKSWTERRVLDVGSGLGIFPYRLQQETDVEVMALDPDPTAVLHLESIGLRAIPGTLEAHNLTERFDIVTVVKVLEHVEQLDVFLSRVRGLLCSQGLVYVEVPDADAASKDAELPEEFFIEHLWGFTKRSCKMLLHSQGFDVRIVEAVLEPSGKRTLRVIASLA